MRTLCATTGEIRQINRKLILDRLKRVGDATIAEVARLTGLSIASCSNITTQLLKSGEVIKQKDRASNGGRPARRFLYNADQANIAYFMLKRSHGYSEVRYAVTNAGGKTVSKGEKSLRNLTLRDLDVIVDSLKADFAVKVVAIAVPGVVTNGTVTQCDIPSLVGVSLKNHIKDRFDIAAVVENDMNFAAVTYHKMMAEGPDSDLAFIAFPSYRCPGCGLIVNNKLVRGRSNYAGEMAALIPLLKTSGPLGPGKENQRAHLAGKFVAVITAMVNPDIVVIAGDMISPDMLQPITRMCASVIPEMHMPKILLQADYEKECFAGMQLMAFNFLMNMPVVVQR